MINWLKGILGMPRDLPRFILVGGIPFTGYDGRETYTEIRKIGRFSTILEAEAYAKQKWDDYGGLFLLLDTEKM